MTSHSDDSVQAEQSVKVAADEDCRVIMQQLQVRLVERGVDVAELAWLSGEETESCVQHWIDLGAERRYSRFALIAPPGTDVSRGEYEMESSRPGLTGALEK